MINSYKPKLTNLQQGILRLFFAKSGISLNQRGIAKLLNVSPPAVMKALPELEKLGFLKRNQDKESKRWSIELNRENPKSLQLKRAHNLKKIYESGLADFLREEFPGTAIILFGSYSRGEDVTGSDIDIAVIGTKKKEIELTEFDKKLERTIFVNFYESFKNIHKDLKNNILNGIILSGSIEI